MPTVLVGPDHEADGRRRGCCRSATVLRHDGRGLKDALSRIAEAGFRSSVLVAW